MHNITFDYSVLIEIHLVDRDTFIANVIALNGSNFAFSVGVLANQIAEDYLKSIFETDYDLREVELKMLWEAS